MITNNETKMKSGQDGRPEVGRSWSDLEQLARRVIRAANLAVMTHAELEALTPSETSASHTLNTVKKAG